MKALSFLMMLLAVMHVKGQVNAYARVTSISSTTLSVSSVNESFASFSAGTQIIIMQMQDNVIGTTTDIASFGNISTIASTGMYEVAVISSIVRSGGVPTQIVINSPLAKTYNINSNSIVQVISYPVLGAGNYSTTSAITAVPWNGFVGGVVAFQVNGILTLNYNVSADHAGFRGGTINGGTAGNCEANVYRSAASDLYAHKGEGIFRISNSNHVAGRGKIINGGGGGNSHNGGGGGGANITAGGEGGKGYGCTSNAGGLGGIELATFVSADRVFMGGGGGAGEANNAYNTAGGNGGGIVIIKADQIRTSGVGSAIRITANGGNAAEVGNDGAGAGGAGGSVMLVVPAWNIVSTKPLIISANGGDGGSVTDATAHGGGAGGGQGAVIFSTATPVTNITATTNNGKGGRNYAGGTFAGDGAGVDNQGIYNSAFALLRHTDGLLRIGRNIGEHFTTKEIEVHPNPVKNSGSVSIYSTRKTEVSLQILNLHGVVVVSSIHHLYKGDNTVSIPDVNSLRTGCYQVIVGNANGTKTTRMLVVK